MDAPVAYEGSILNNSSSFPFEVWDCFVTTEQEKTLAIVKCTETMTTGAALDLSSPIYCPSRKLE